MRRYLLLITICGTFLSSCKQDVVVPYAERVLYHEAFDTWGNWERQPNSNGFYADSCVLVENGLLQMTRQSGINGCGGTWVGIIIRDSASFEPEMLENIGIRLKLERGNFNKYVTYHDTIDANGNPDQMAEATVITSTFWFRYNKYSISLPGGGTDWFHRDSTINLDAHKLEGSFFEFICDNGELKSFVDGVETNLNKVGFGASSGVSQNLRMEFRLGHHPMLNPLTDELFVDDIEIYTWVGEKNY